MCGFGSMPYLHSETFELGHLTKQKLFTAFFFILKLKLHQINIFN